MNSVEHIYFPEFDNETDNLLLKRAIHTTSVECLPYIVIAKNVRITVVPLAERMNTLSK